jgi:hypothetical protein
MQITTLYRYERSKGEITVSPQKPEGVECTTLFRLIADDFKTLTNGETTAPVIDTDSVEGWVEVDVT